MLHLHRTTQVHKIDPLRCYTCTGQHTYTKYVPLRALEPKVPVLNLRKPLPAYCVDFQHDLKLAVSGGLTWVRHTVTSSHKGIIRSSFAKDVASAYVWTDRRDNKHCTITLILSVWLPACFSLSLTMQHSGPPHFRCRDVMGSDGSQVYILNTHTNYGLTN
jgi:hypothetical protein